MEGLRDQSRAPHRHPNALTEASQERILKVRAEHPYWGARKIRAFLKRQEGADVIPAMSTIGNLLKTNGLTIPRKRRPRARPSQQPLAHATEANRVWCADFKGWFRSGNGDRIDPLTISDAYSRYLLRCQAVRAADLAHSQPIFEAAFREYGLPDRMRTDNGAPFGSNGESGLTGLSVWWIKLGIVPERIQPGKPQQNGRHERMHRTLKPSHGLSAGPQSWSATETLRPVPMGVQRAEAPRSAGASHACPSCYVPSARPYPRRLAEVEYRKAGRCGGFPRVDRYAGQTSTKSWPTPCREK